ncbi:hypothetical protein BLNAU_9767 [Blattamonas nauphoetae]|uniref:Uncharacterized protein n=1 Tax=Blattamonas nauphoetae TaxID=2049346 RepID=A0ABQ9XUR1_9EUKA|nr:hypothetical protein BLNAU_9767 [Blattamonas nauphoetae]
MLLIPLLVVSHAISLEHVIQHHFEQNQSNRFFRDQLTLDSTQYECRNLGINDSSLKLQGNWNTKIILDEHAIHTNRFSALLCISNSSVELDGLQLDAYHNHPNTPHRPYSSGYAGQSISVLSICSSSIVVSNSEIRVPPQQSPFVITGSENVGMDETTHISVQNSSLFSSSSISRATTLILPNARDLGLCISMMSCNIDSTQIGSDTGLLVQVANSPGSSKNFGRIETLLSGNHIENVTRTSSISTSVLCGSIVRDMSLGGDLLSTNTSFVSCSTSSVQPLSKRTLDNHFLKPYLEGAYEWEGENFGDGTLFHFFDFSTGYQTYFSEGSRFLFSSYSHTIRFTRCTFTNIDGKDADDEYRDTDGAAIIIRCPSSLLVEECQFSNCGGSMHGGAIDIVLEQEHSTASITSTSFEESGIIVSNCLFNYNGSMFYSALYVDGDKSQILYTSFSSDTKAELDVSIIGISRLLSLAIEIVEGEVVVKPGSEPNSLQTALTGNPDAKTFFLGGGNYGTFEIDSGNITLKPWNSQDNLNPTTTIITSFSMTVKTGAECTIRMFQLAPLDESSSLVSTLGTCSLQYVVVDQIDGCTVPLFSVTGTGSHLSIYECQITNIRNATANLIKATDGAEIELTNTLLTQITTTQSVISVQDCAAVDLWGTTITHVHHKEREGQLQWKFSNCESAPGNPTHLLVEGLTEDKTRSLLRKCELYGTAPHFGWKNEDDSGTGFGTVATSYLTFTLTSSSVIQSPHLLIDNIHPSEFYLDEIVHVIMGNAYPSQVTSVVNVSTTGKGAFLSSSSNDQGVTIDMVFFINCSAEAGGAVFIEDTRSLTVAASFRDCTARTDGGGMMIVDNTGSGDVHIDSSFINCQAQRGGGLFLRLSEGNYLPLGNMRGLDIFQRSYTYPAFDNCLAEQGAGVYIDGTMRGDNFYRYDVGFNNWRAQGLGTDIFFAKAYISITSCQVYFESSPSDSFDFSLPKFELSGSGTAVASPFTASQLHSFSEITPYLHLIDDRGRMINATVIVGSEFCIFECGFCSSQHISFIKDEQLGGSSVKVKRDSDAPLYDLVALELDADAVIEFHNLIFAIECPFQMMLVKHRSARGLFETCELLFDAGMELPLALFEVEDGTLSLTQTLISVKGDEGTFTVNDFVLTAAPLILVAPTDSTTSSPTVILDHVTLRRMRLKSGVVSLMLFDFSASVEVNEVEFIDCNQTLSEEAKRIIATGSNLEGVVEKWNGFETLSDPADPLSWAIDNAESPGSIWHTIPLRVAFVRFECQSITVQPKGKDLAGCGEGSWNCRGLARAGKNVGGNQPCTITIVESSFLNGEFDPPAKRTSVESSSSKSVIDVWKEGRMVNSPDGGQAPILTLSHLSFSLPPALNTDSLIESLGGELTVNDCWFVSSSPISFHLLSATSGVVDIDSIVISELEFSSTLINLVGLDSATIESLTLSDLPEVALVSAEGQPSKKWTLAISRSTFSGQSTSTNEAPTDSERLCSWESGSDPRDEQQCDTQPVRFDTQWIPSASFPSARQNIRCVGTGKISFESFSTESMLSETDLWVSADDECVVDGENISPRHTFFEPSLITKNCSSEFVKKEDRYSVEIVGTKLIPCGLSLEVFEDDSSSANADKSEVIDLSELTTTWTETSISLAPCLSPLRALEHSSMADPHPIRRNTHDRIIRTEDEYQAGTCTTLSHTLPWLIPLIVVIIVAIVVVVVVIVVLQRRKRKSQNRETRWRDKTMWKLRNWTMWTTLRRMRRTVR